MPIEITMPRLSDTMEAGTVVKWNVKEGDEVSAGDVVADIETDKATMEMQVFDDGTMARIIASEGETIDIGTVIAILAEEDEDASTVATAEPTASNGAASSSASAPTTTTAPSASEDSATAPEKIASADKETRSSAAAGDGAKKRVSPVARRLAEEHGVDLAAISGSGPGGRIIKRDILQAVETGAETRSAVAPTAAGSRAMTHAGAKVVEATRVQPVADEESDSAIAVPASFGLQDQIVPLNNMRQTIARRLVESKTTIPHYQVTYSFNMDPLISFRADLNEKLARQNIKLSVNDFLVRACALAMHEHPEFNASWGNDSIHIHGQVNIGIAVALPRERGGGLVVATIRHADRKSLREISFESKSLSEKARKRGLTIDEMSDSTFTLSNLGMFGVDSFTAIINPPNSAILAVGGAIKKPVVRDDELTVGHEMNATLSSDHRVIDGAMAAQYLATLREYIESPELLLV